MKRTRLNFIIAIAIFLFPHIAFADGLYSLYSEIVSNEIQTRTVQETTSKTDQPIETTKERNSEEVFGIRGGYVHPFLSVAGYYTDNVFYTQNNKKSDFALIISPGIWLAVPRIYEKLVNIETTNISPGGFSSSKSSQETFKRYQLYLFYNADFERFSKFSSANAVSHKVQGLLQYNLKNGLSLELMDQYTISQDTRGTGITNELDKYTNNLANITLSYDISHRVKVRADYSNFLVDYTAARNNFRDRSDNAVSGYIFYKIRPKTSLFAQYELVDIAYKIDDWQNSKEHHLFGGIQWNITAKSKGNVKAGYGTKEFTDLTLKKASDFVMEAQVDYSFTPKTSINLNASRRTTETNVAGTDYVLSNQITLGYMQKLTGKITGDINLTYSRDDHKGKVTNDKQTGNLIDKYYKAAFALRYKFKAWLHVDLGYIFDKRVSNFSEFDYRANIFFLRLTGAL
jgi:polysaccharide biosynthesis protein VpsM